MECGIITCNNNSNNDDETGVTFHRFPTDLHSCQLWFKTVGHIITDGEYSVICSDHFKDDDYCIRNGVRELRNGAIPFYDQDEHRILSKVCRICLVRNVKMYSLKRYGLSNMYQELTGINLEDNSNYPQHLCWECAARLKSSIALKEKALRTEEITKLLLDHGNKMTVQDIKGLNRQECDLQTTLIQTFLDLDDVIVYKDNGFINNFESEIKEEAASANNTYNDECVKNVEDENESIEQDDIEDEDVQYIELDIDSQDEDSDDIDNEQDLEESLKKQIYFSSDVSDANMSDSDSEVTGPIKGNEQDENLEKNVMERKAVKRRNVTRSVASKKANTSKSGPPVQIKLDENLFTITTMTPEEQIAEIERRKESASYAVAPFKCTVCYRVFKNKANRDAHVVRHTDKKGTFTCYICKTRMKTKKALNCHLSAGHTKKFSCNLCPFVSKSRSIAWNHEKFHKGIKYQCSQCGANFTKISTYNNHLRKHVSNFVCELCGNTFVNEKGVEVHKMIAHHLTKKTLKSQQKLKGPYCEACDVKFLSVEAYETHFKFTSKHSTDIQSNYSKSYREYVCQLCGLSFRTTKSLSEHIEGNHPSGETVPANGPYCEDCNIRFVSEEALDKHIKVSVKHSADKSWIASSKTRLPERRESARPDQPIPCEQCGVLLKDFRAYNGHFLSEHPDKNRTTYLSGSAPCMCEVCGRIFPCFGSLRDHSWVHTDEKPFDCDTCGKAFQTRHNLALHRQKHIRKTNECSVCGKHFYSQSNKQRHMMIHTGVKPHKCDLCGKVFATNSDKQSHKEHVHFKKPWPKKTAKQKKQNIKSEDNDGDEIHSD